MSYDEKNTFIYFLTKSRTSNRKLMLNIPRVLVEKVGKYFDFQSVLSNVSQNCRDGGKDGMRNERFSLFWKQKRGRRHGKVIFLPLFFSQTRSFSFFFFSPLRRFRIKNSPFLLARSLLLPLLKYLRRAED